jgi:hypothetical protein
MLLPLRIQARFPPKPRFRPRATIRFIRKTQPERTGVPVNRNSNGWWRGARQMGIALLLAVSFSGCKRFEYVSTKPLDDAGFTYSVIQDIKGLDINNAEVDELAKAKNGGVSERACVELVRVARSRKQRFTAGAEIAQLRSAGVGDDAVVELLRLDQLGAWTGEAEAIRLAGISDRVVLAVAHRRAEGKPALSGGSLTKLKNAGLSEPTIYELTVRGLTNTEAEDLAARRYKGGFSEADVLRSYPGH